MKSRNYVATSIRDQGRKSRVFVGRISNALKVALVLLLTFGISAIGNAAQKIKRRVRNAKSTLKSSYSAHMMARAWNYFQPSWEPLPDPSATVAIVQQIEKAVEDQDNRIEKDFKVPSKLRNRVRFWVDVYARFSSQYRIIHDRENPELVYGYIDMRPLYRAFPSRVAHAKAYQIEKMVVKSIKAKISEAMDISKPRTATITKAERESIRKMMSAFDASSPEKALTLLRRMRSQTGQQDHFLAALSRSEKLLPQIETVFKAKGLPVALTRLPFVETSFNPRAVSKTGALGMWQFMPDTARLFDPRGTRKDWVEPMRQSRNAARMLTILYSKLPNWGIAVTGYNSGGARLARLAEKYGARDIEDLLKIPASRDTLGFAGRNFFCELMAANIVVAYQQQLFSQRAMHLSRSGVSRRVQSLIETGLSAEDVAAANISSEAHDRAPQSVHKSHKRKHRASKHRRHKFGNHHGGKAHKRMRITHHGKHIGSSHRLSKKHLRIKGRTSA